MTKQYIRLDDIDSTNSYAKSLKDYPDNGLVVIRAKRQTSGLGREGKPFFSDHPGGLWVSIVTPIADISTHFEHNRAICLAIFETIKAIAGSAPVAIKWPNDIYWGEKKIAGILMENIARFPGTIAIGFGVNVNIDTIEFPDDLRKTATSTLIETGQEHSPDQLLEDILKRYLHHVSGDQTAAYQLYRDNLYKKGGAATVNGQAGKFITVDPDGRMRFETERGHVLFSSGTLTFKNSDTAGLDDGA